MSNSDSTPTLGTTIKLNGSNYLLWSRAFLLFLGSQNKRNHVLVAPPAATDATFTTWSQSDCSVMTWLLNSMDESVSKNIMFLDIAKAMWDALREMYSNDKNVSRVFELYEKLFSHCQDGQSVNDYFSTLKGLADEILVYHPLSCDATTRQKQWEEFMVAKFLSGLDHSLRPTRDSLLASDNVPTLSNALSRVLRVATGRTDDGSSPLPDTSAMFARGRGSFRGRSRGRGRGTHTTPGDRSCVYCGRSNHVSEKCWAKFGKPDWANNTSADNSSASAASTTAGVFAVTHGQPRDTLASTPLPIPSSPDMSPPKPLHVYTRRPRPAFVSCPPSSPPSAAPNPSPPSDIDLPIALRKGKFEGAVPTSPSTIHFSLEHENEKIIACPDPKSDQTRPFYSIYNLALSSHNIKRLNTTPMMGKAQEEGGGIPLYPMGYYPKEIVPHQQLFKNIADVAQSLLSGSSTQGDMMEFSGG
ncbi:hypothetical protein C2S51_034946 [Perilla frutescens var. frutescens]|nr:hypothetical protein C2S51_034946 [Perilla frutescens var. frutescens]